jgi:hypothetical protein
VIDRARILNAQRSGHGENRRRHPRITQAESVTLTPSSVTILGPLHDCEFVRRLEMCTVRAKYPPSREMRDSLAQ